VSGVDPLPVNAPGASRAGEGRSLFGHPPGLTVLFLTQMWAEFSYFGLQALLVYYMTRHLGYSQASSSMIYGGYGAAAFFSPLFGGMIADRWLGRTRSVVAGGLLMMAGHFAMAWEALLFPALALVALGNGLFLPPLAVQVGSLYADDDPRKAGAFSAYYMGINLGGLLAPLFCGTLGEVLGWHWGFGAAGIGMLAGLTIYLGFSRYLPREPQRTSLRKEAISRDGGERRDAMLLLSIVVVVILFRIGYEQSGNAIALWVDGQTDRSVSFFGHASQIPATWFQSINPLLIILLTPLLIRLWSRRARPEGHAHLMRRMSLGCIFAAAAAGLMVAAALTLEASGHRVSPWWTVGYFVLLTLGELMVVPIGLTLVETLAPARFAAAAMGGWYIAKFAGSLLAGIMGGYWSVANAPWFFAASALSALLAAGLLLALAKLSSALPGKGTGL
jgi:POT family proton-dependent oligopeptide transporter